ncbi:MAG: DUF72 domain-containing protein, partial [Thaumarchaeota archaeon]|nr:DUF72 domain-containing protein [Nitrososphaerota archaeon]
GWSYEDWVGPFYPKGSKAGDYLQMYSSVFDSVEIDSSFYRIPNQFMITQWRNNTPEGFLFSPKLPKKITHEKKLKDSESTLVYFYSVVSKLKDKLGPIAIQLPPSIKLSTHLELMKGFVSQLSPEFKHAIEFRHKSWFVPEVYSLLRKNNIAMIWSLNQYLETPPEVTADFVYLRMVGDREITEFNGIQRDRSEDLKRWASSVKENSSKFESGYVFFNNHFAGFSPESANEFRRLLGLMELDWKAQGTEQRTLFG